MQPFYFINTLTEETLNSCFERNFGSTSRVTKHKPLPRGLTLSKKKLPGASFLLTSIKKLWETNCNEDSYKLKIYGERAALPLDRSVKISLKEATKHELQESKTAEIDSVRKSGIDVDKEGNNQDLKSQFLRTNDNFPVVFNEKDWATFEIARLKNLQSRNE